MELTFEHEIVFSTKGRVPVTDIVRSLTATANASMYVPLILSRIFPDLTVDNIEIELHRVEHQSPLLEKYVIKVTAAFQHSIEQFMEKTGQSLGLDILQKNKKLISYFIVVVLFYGAIEAAKMVWADKPTVHIEGNNNIVLMETGKACGLTAQEIKEAVAEALKEVRTKRLARDAVNFFAPAKSEPGVSVTASQDIVISSGTVSEIPDPATFEAMDADEWSDHFENVEIDIRVIDRDKGDKGWKAKIPSIGDNRIRLTIVPGIDLAALDAVSANGPIQGDVIVEFRRNPDGSDRPIAAHLYRVHGPSPMEADATLAH